MVVIVAACGLELRAAPTHMCGRARNRGEFYHRNYDLVAG